MEREAKARWAHTFDIFRQTHNLSKKELNNFLRSYEQANVAGIRVDAVRPRWDFTGAFYFVGTVVSTIGETDTFFRSKRLSFCCYLFVSFRHLLYVQILWKAAGNAWVSVRERARWCLLRFWKYL